MADLLVCGAINWDINCFVERLPLAGEEVVAASITRVSGGTGGNVAVAAARILGAGRVAVIGALGEDDVAREQAGSFRTEGVLSDGIDRIAGEESGQAYVLVDRDGQNTIASYPGANARLGVRHLKRARVIRHIKQCRGIVITDPPLEVAGELIHEGKQNYIPVLWDPGVLVKRDQGELLSSAKDASILLLNETEAGALLGTTDLDTSVHRLRHLGFENRVVFKLGSRGAVMVVMSEGMAIEVPAFPLKELGLKVTNTVGCGDAFAGVLAAYQALGVDARKSLIMAGAAAGLTATLPETRGSPDRGTVEEIVKRSEAVGFGVRERNLF